MELSLDEFKVRAQSCTEFQCLNYQQPHISGLRKVKSIDAEAIRYFVEGIPTAGHTDWPRNGLYRLERNTITWLNEDGIECFTYVFPFAADVLKPRYVLPGEANMLLADAIAVGDHRPHGVTVWHRDGSQDAVFWSHMIVQKDLPGDQIDEQILASGATIYHVDLSVGGQAWYRLPNPATARLLLPGVTDAVSDGARFTRDGWTLHLAYPSGLCMRLAPTGIDSRLVDAALLASTQGPGWDDPKALLDLADQVLRAAGRR